MSVTPLRRVPRVARVAHQGRSAASAALALLLGALAGCGDDGAPAAVPSASSTTAGPTCEAAPSTTFARWPAGVPADFPKPPSAAITSVTSDAPGLVAVKLSTAVPLRDAKLFVLDRLPRGGFTIVGGDSEPHEADIPFARDHVLGQIRISRVDDCHTDWLVFVSGPTSPGARPPSLPVLPSSAPS